MVLKPTILDLKQRKENLFLSLMTTPTLPRSQSNEWFKNFQEIQNLAFVLLMFVTPTITTKSLKPPICSTTQSSYSTGFNGAGAGVRKEIFKKVGFYPGEFFLYMNEADCSLRIRDLGYEIRFFPDLIAYHKMAAKNRKSWRALLLHSKFILADMEELSGFDCFKRNIITQFPMLYHSMEQLTFIYIKALFSAFWNISKLPAKDFL